MDINFILRFSVQKAIELLAFYLVLANLTGKGLKLGFRRLYAGKQWYYYENIALFFAYLAVITVLRLQFGHMAELVSYASIPFISLILAKSSDFKKAFLANAFTFVAVAIVALIYLFLISIHPLINSSLVLVIVMLAVWQMYFYKTYKYLAKRKMLLNLVTLVAIIFYFFILLSGLHQHLFLLIVSLFSFYVSVKLLTNKGIEKERLKTMDFISNATYGELLLFLRELANTHRKTDHIEHLIMEDQLLDPRLVEALSSRLKQFKKEQVIGDGACQIINGNIQVSIVSKEWMQEKNSNDLS